LNPSRRVSALLGTALAGAVADAGATIGQTWNVEPALPLGQRPFIEIEHYQARSRFAQGRGPHQIYANAANSSQIGPYVLMIAVPVVGYLMIDANADEVAFFGWTAPDLVATDKIRVDSFKALHAAVAWALTATVAAHAGAAIRHHVIVGDCTMQRMLHAAHD
jgi:cytochrome b561